MNHPPRCLKTFFVLLLALAAFCPPSRADQAPAVKPIQALLITGGCCHDYARQMDILTQGISARANVQWTIFFENGDTKTKMNIYGSPVFAEGIDVIVHNECNADVDDLPFIEKALAPHRNGLPAVVIHCTLHTFRSLKTDQWREFIGMSSNHHGPQQPIAVKILQPRNPIMIGLPADWTTWPEELYSIDKVWPNAQPLAEAYAQDEKKIDPVIWTNLYNGKTRVFGTSLAHNDYTMENPVYLSLVTRGLLWACDKLGDNGQPKPGYGPQTGAKN